METRGGVTLSTDLVPEGVVTLTSGNFILGTYDLTIASTGSFSGGSSGSYVATTGSGRLVQNNVGTTPVSFPVGTGTSFNPVTIQTGVGEDIFAVNVIGSVSPASLNDPAAVQRTWVLAEATPGENGTITVSVQWDGGQEGAAFNRSNSASWRFDGARWVLDGTFVSLTGSDPYVETVDVPGSSNGDWTIGNVDGGLPVQLLSFTEQLQDPTASDCSGVNSVVDEQLRLRGAEVGQERRGL